MIIERDEEGWYVGSIPELPGCHTQAQSVEELAQRMQEAMALYLDDSGEITGGMEFVGVHKISVV